MSQKCSKAILWDQGAQRLSMFSSLNLYLAHPHQLLRRQLRPQSDRSRGRPTQEGDTDDKQAGSDPPLGLRSLEAQCWVYYIMTSRVDSNTFGLQTMQGEGPIKPAWSLKDLIVLLSSMPNQENPILKPSRKKWWAFPGGRWGGGERSGIYHSVRNRKHPIGSKGKSYLGKLWSSTGHGTRAD